MPTAGNLLCARCGRFCRCLKNSISVEELDETGAPYRIWDADLFECPSCRHEVISGFAREPLAESWQPSYAAQRARLAERGPIYPGRTG